jgi:hypothetical protein
MRLSRRTLLFALIVAAVCVWGYNTFLFVRAEAGASTPSAAAPIRQQSPAQPVVSRAADRDPFYSRLVVEARQRHRPPGPGKEPVRLPQCHIGGIVYAPGNAMAIFLYKGASTMVREGDTVDSMVIRKIEPDSVRISYKGALFSLGK